MSSCRVFSPTCHPNLLYRLRQVRVLSLDPEDALKVAAVQAVDATPESLLMLDSPVAESGADGAAAGAAALFLHTGAHLPNHAPAENWGFLGVLGFSRVHPRISADLGAPPPLELPSPDESVAAHEMCSQ